MSLMRTGNGWIAAVVVTAQAAIGAAAAFTAARYVRGEVPAAPVASVSGGEVWLAAVVTSDGRVGDVDVLRTTPPMTDLMVAKVREWQFNPATSGTESVPTRVLIAGMFAPPTLLGPTLGEPPKTIAPPPVDVPQPTSATPASYPPLARGEGTVLVEVAVSDLGTIVDVRVVASAPGFDSAAISAARAWRFQPARRDGRPVAGYAYLAFAFRPPVTM